MQNRLRLLMGATALLYLGPLLAGLAGFGWLQVPVFVALFVLWLVILRPQRWPSRLAGWKKPEALVTLAAQTATQALLVLVCFGIGRGIGGVTGLVLPLPELLPIGISLLAIPLSRMIWNPWQGPEIDRFSGGVMATTAGGGLAAAAQLATELLKPLAALPADTPVAEVEAHLAALARHLDPATLRDALLDDPGPGLLRALMIHASQPATLAALAGSDYPAQAFSAAGSDAPLLGLLAARLSAVLRVTPALAADFPEPKAVLGAADRSPDPGTAAALRDLARALAPQIG